MTVAVSRPWKIVFVTPGGRTEQKYRSRPAMYRAAEEHRADIAGGFSRTIRMSAYQWDADRGAWVLYEQLPITTAAPPSA